MDRDGALTSLWQSDMPSYQPTNPFSAATVFEVVIVGGGITGVTTAHLLQEAGIKCLLIEAHSLGFGTTGGTTAHLNNFFDSTYAQIESNFGKESSKLLLQASTEALDLYKKHIATLQIDCGYSEKDGFLFAQDDKEDKELTKILEASEAAGAAVSRSSNIPVPIPFTSAINYHRQGQLHPIPYLYALAKAYEGLGGIILQSCGLQGVEAGEILSLTTDTGKIQAQKIIYATHIPPGINLLDFRCAPYRSYVMAVRLEDEQYPEQPAYDMKDPYHYYRTQEVAGKKYLIAGGEDHKTGHQEDTEQPFIKLESYLKKYFKIDHIAYKWSSQYFDPADGLAYIGRLPGGAENIFVATGFGGNGMTYSHIAATHFRDLFTRGESPYEKLFSPSRIKPVAGFTSFVKEAADVVSEFIGKRLTMDKIEGLAEIANESGKVVKYEGHAMAIHKSASGEVLAVNPVCPHAHCVITWNGAEKSWDCPCHGARYNIKGEVLTGPSTKDLEKIEWKDG